MQNTKQNIDTDNLNKIYIQYYELLHNINRYCPNVLIQEYIDKFQTLDINLVLVRFMKIMQQYEDALKTNYNDSLILNNDIFILPDIDIKKYWINFDDKQKKKIWLNLRVIYLRGKLLIDHEVDEYIPSTSISETVDGQHDTVIKIEEEKKEELYVDPILGVGADIKNYDVNQLFKGTETLDNGKIGGPSISSFAKLIGVDKMFDVSKITDQLKSMTKEDIENATQSISNLLNTKADEKTQSFLKDLLDQIKDQLNNVDFTEGDPYKKIENISSCVAKSMKSQVMKGEVDFNGILDNTKGLVKEFAQKGDSGINEKQFGMLDNFLKDMQKNPAKVNNKKYMDNMFKQFGADPKEMNKIMKTMKKK